MPILIIKKTPILFFILLNLWLLPFSGLAATFGETGPGTSYTFGLLGRVRATQFPCNETGWVDQIRMYIYTPAGAEGRVAIYADAGGDLPGSLLEESSSQVLSTGWNQFNIPPVWVNSGNTYWLAMQTNSDSVDLGMYVSDPNPNRSQLATWSYGPFPNPTYPPPGNSWDRVYCLYATLVGSVPTATATLTYSPTPPATLTVTATPAQSATLTTPTTTSTSTVTLTSQATPLNSTGEYSLYLDKNTINTSQTEQVSLTYQLGKTEMVTIRIYNLLGEPVITLINQTQDSGYNHILTWDGRNKDKQPCPAGLYFIQLQSNSAQIRKKLVIIK